MSVNHIFIIVSVIISTVSILFLNKYLKNIDEVMFENGKNESQKIINKLNELETKIKNSQRDTLVHKEKVSYSSDIEKLLAKGYSKEEIAKKTNKSIREIDLILRLREGGKS
ncbi:hypothetical protein [Alkalithermobacter paradoxus]|uniref:Uncharacterized protein n=1 Tax=Alkalithermobacter paradoxus TaxID=29349 RepID=A0A1V4IC70_9FIRM|nr:hypothetical protein CLOTH_04000 [[Clostridium] thermoalcaliphilum]